MDPSSWAAVAIALLALAFTVGSFWWLHARLGRVRLAGTPRNYALHFDNERLTLTVPLLFVNDGPTPIVILDLRLKEEATGFVGRFEATLDEVYGDKGRAFATGFVVGGDQARLLICQFQGARRGNLLVGAMLFQLEGFERRLRGRAQWRRLGTFDVNVDQRGLDNQKSFIIHENKVG